MHGKKGGKERGKIIKYIKERKLTKQSNICKTKLKDKGGWKKLKISPGGNPHLN